MHFFVRGFVGSVCICLLTAASHASTFTLDESPVPGPEASAAKVLSEIWSISPRTTTWDYGEWSKQIVNTTDMPIAHDSTQIDLEFEMQSDHFLYADSWSTAHPISQSTDDFDIYLFSQPIIEDANQHISGISDYWFLNVPNIGSTKNLPRQDGGNDIVIVPLPTPVLMAGLGLLAIPLLRRRFK